VLHSALSGEAGLIRWPAWDLGYILKSGLRCFLSFLAGPVVPAGVALYFWLNSGDLAAVDRLILFELGLLTFAYWALLLISAEESNDWRAVGPASVAGLVRRHGYRALLTALLAGLGVLAVVPAGLAALESLHGGLDGWAALTALAGAALFWLFFLLRCFGLSCFYSPRGGAKGRKPPSPAGPLPVARPAGAADRSPVAGAP
jgi:hypothetical protein